MAVENGGMAARTTTGPVGAWGCDAESVVAAFDAEDGGLSTSH
jgi:hypothetical protein